MYHLIRQYVCLPVLKMSPPLQSFATTSGNFSNVSRFTDSQPKSSNAITSHSVMHLLASAPAPPIAHRYTALLRTIASHTSCERSPLPIIAQSPISRSFGANLSILPEVVGVKIMFELKEVPE